MKLVFTSHGWDDYLYWQRTDRNLLKRINRLLDEVLRDPFTGIGKPEQLRHASAGNWSRRSATNIALFTLWMAMIGIAPITG